ncbi:hypothetical protein IWQ60_007879 [Tieghemiomyces parasiticus]|uniref:Uncharacterized protein n=1 Tax=Tieghemiomyces parasiticus TaxID=78921 RepID=A0A9W8DMW5_9FUNG|nr:hypothetical protein IWQ60_007879 [Tieghemiomyces parasiticus]
MRALVVVPLLGLLTAPITVLANSLHATVRPPAMSRFFVPDFSDDSDDYVAPPALPAMELTEEPLPLPENLYSGALSSQERQARRALFPFRRELTQALKDFRMLRRKQLVEENNDQGAIESQYVAKERLESFLQLVTVNLPASTPLTPPGSDPLPDHDAYLPADTLQQLLSLLAETPALEAKAYDAKGQVMYPLQVIFWLMDSAAHLTVPVLPQARPVVNIRLLMGFLALASGSESIATYSVMNQRGGHPALDNQATKPPMTEATKYCQSHLAQSRQLDMPKDENFVNVDKLHRFIELTTLPSLAVEPEHYAIIADRLVHRDLVTALVDCLSANNMVSYEHLKQLISALNNLKGVDAQKQLSGHALVSLRILDVYIDQLYLRMR